MAAGGGLIAFLFSRWLDRFTSLIDVLDAAGLSLFAITWTPTLSATTTNAAPTRAGIAYSPLLNTLGTCRISTSRSPPP